MSQNVVANDQIRPTMIAGDRRATLPIQESNNGRNAFFHRNLGDVGCGLDAENRYAARNKVLKEITVITRHLYHLARGAEVQSLDHRLGISPCMFNPAR